MMHVTVLRQDGVDTVPYEERYSYDGQPHVSVLQLLAHLNDHPELCMGSVPACPIAFDTSCEQGMCGACAMLVNGMPRLACRSFCDELATRDGVIDVRPLSKFPVIRDLMVDRSQIARALVRERSWLEGEANVPRRATWAGYEASLCLQCGCCLEACPNYAKGDLFVGAVGALAAANVLDKESDAGHRAEVGEAYGRDFFAVCSKNGACELACPIGLPVMPLVSEANRGSVWGFWQRLAKR